MDATMILIDSDAELARARALVDRLWSSNDPTDIVRLEAQARLIAAYEERKWPRRAPSLADMIRHLMDQHGLTRADMVPILGTPSRVSEVLGGKKGLSMAMVQRLRARFRVPADLLLPPPKKSSARRAPKRAAARVESFGVVSTRTRGQSRVLIRRSGRTLIVPWRTNIAHLHRPWRATSVYAIGAQSRRFCEFHGDRTRSERKRASRRPYSDRRTTTSAASPPRCLIA